MLQSIRRFPAFVMEVFFLQSGSDDGQKDFADRKELEILEEINANIVAVDDDNVHGSRNTSLKLHESKDTSTFFTAALSRLLRDIVVD